MYLIENFLCLSARSHPLATYLHAKVHKLREGCKSGTNDYPTARSMVLGYEIDKNGGPSKKILVLTNWGSKRVTLSLSQIYLN